MYLQYTLLKIRKKSIWKFTFSKYHVHCLYLFQTSQTANQYQNTCHYMANCLYLHDSYITKFDFVNYAFANLVAARLYLFLYNSCHFVIFNFRGCFHRLLLVQYDDERPIKSLLS